MYNRTHQLECLAEGRSISNAYRPDCIITITNNSLLQGQTAEDNVRNDETFGSAFSQYLLDIENTRKCIKYIHDGADSINKLMNLSLDVVTTEQNDDISNKLNKLIEKTNIICTQCKSNIKRLEPCKALGSHTEARMRTNAYNVCIKHFQDAMRRYQDSQVNFRKSIKERAARQIQLIYPNMKQTELDEIMSNPTHSTVEYIAKTNIIGNVTLRDAVSNIQGKYNDIIALEQSMEGLKQMMVELAGIVSYQGDLIEQIEHNALKAVDYTERANVQLIKARENKLRSNKIFMWSSFVAILGGVAIIVPVVMKLT